MFNILIFLLLLAGPLHAQNARETTSFMSLARNVDWSCMRMKVGACAIGPDPGVHLRYWEPVVVMETVKKPGDYVIREIGSVVGPLAKKTAAIEMSLATGLPNTELTSANSWQAVGGSNLQFNEAHLYDFPLKLFMSAALCPSIPNATLGVRYFSELNSVRWRKGTGEVYIPQMVGKWGSLSPRIGFAVHASPGAVSGLNSLRAINAASMDFTVNTFIDQMQMLYPQKTMCMAPGTDPRSWEPGRVSRSGDYVWLYWRYRECCKPVIPPP